MNLAVAVLHELKDLVVLVRREDEARAAGEELLEERPGAVDLPRHGEIDAQVERTRGRPLPLGEVNVVEALVASTRQRVIVAMVGADRKSVV